MTFHTSSNSADSRKRLREVLSLFVDPHGPDFMQLKPQLFAGFHLVTIQRDVRTIHDYRAGLTTVTPRRLKCPGPCNR